jgi:hypothetical protein
MDRLRAYGFGACAGILVVALVPLLVAISRPDPLGPPDLVPRWLVLGLAIAVPALIGAIGTRQRDPALLIAAACLCLPFGILSFATIPILIPAVLLVVAAASVDGSRGRLGWLRAIAIVALGVGALTGLLGTTETRCWLAFDSPSGMSYRVATEAEAGGPIGGPGGPVAAGCDGGALTMLGATLWASLTLVGLVLAVASPRRHRAPPVGPA